MNVTLRPLLVVCMESNPPGAPSSAASSAVPTALLTSWAVCQADGLSAANTLLKKQALPVGLLLVQPAHSHDGLQLPRLPALQNLQHLLDAHPAMQWLGVFPPDWLRHTECRSLVAQRLFDFHTWPIDPVRLNHALGHAYGFAGLLNDKSEAQTTPGALSKDPDFVGQSVAMQQLYSQIAKVAQAEAPVLIWGESGSGKELTAHAIHRRSTRAKGPFIAVNCGAIPANLIQSELFGYERGAFTGALQKKQGLIESASGGTLFLDEIADLPLELQANLLRFLQEQTINRVGSTQSIRVDARVIAASHTRLDEAVRAGRFREDLLYRINVLPLTVPALRERKEDLRLLARHFFEQFSAERKSRLKGLGPEALQAIEAHDWPGNVRELINRIRRAVVMAEGRLVTPQDLDLPQPVPRARSQSSQGDLLDEARVQAELRAIHDSLQRNGHNITHSARQLGVSRMTLYRLMQKHGISL